MAAQVAVQVAAENLIHRLVVLVLAVITIAITTQKALLLPVMMRPLQIKLRLLLKNRPLLLRKLLLLPRKLRRLPKNLLVVLAF
jgi:hypothetical protein